MEQEEKLSDVVETVRDFTYVSNMMSVDGESKMYALNAILTCWRLIRKCGESVYGKGFYLYLNLAVYKSYVRSAMM